MVAPLLKDGFSHQGEYYLRRRRQILREHLKELLRLEEQRLMLSTSRLSVHAVNFEKSIKKHNLIYQRFHPSKRKSKSSLFSSVKTTTQDASDPSKRRASMSTAETEAHLTPGGLLPPITTEEADGTFRKLGSAITKLIRFNVLTSIPVNADILAEEKTREKDMAKSFTPDMLTRSQLYRQLIEKLHNCLLLATLHPIRQPLESRKRTQ